MHLVVFVLDCVEQCPDLLNAWEQAGAVGITILESTGLRRFQAAMRDDLPLMPSMRDLLAGQETHHRTLFTVVPDEATVDRIITATERLAGDLLQPNSGFLFVVPVSRAVGLQKQSDAKR
jgi:nitrogen regulatory protein P-II 1